jgi:hypothetical protein
MKSKESTQRAGCKKGVLREGLEKIFISADTKRGIIAGGELFYFLTK